jgi:hypothetical protein
MVKSSLVGAAVLLSLTAMASTATAAGCAQYDPTCQTYAAPAQSNNARANRATRETEGERMSATGYEGRASTRLERRHLDSTATAAMAITLHAAINRLSGQAMS